jgi:anti-sigma factor RsiW
MNCNELKLLLDGYSDGELDLVEHGQVEMHVGDCSACRDIYQKNISLRNALAHESFYYRAPAHLRERVFASFEPFENDGREKLSWWQWRPWLSWEWAAAFSLLVIVIMLAMWSVRSPDDALANDLVASHVRSLMADHLTDVASTDQHTVKPWFDGRLDFAPPVIDFAPQGFVLVGGRLDYASNRPVAALVYKRRQHLINLFIYPEPSRFPASEGSTVKQGYNLIHWNQSGMTYWAVSDLNLEELRQLAHLYQDGQQG